MFVTFIIIIISSLVKFDHYRDTRAAILDPCIQGILVDKMCRASSTILSFFHLNFLFIEIQYLIKILVAQSNTTKDKERQKGRKICGVGVNQQNPIDTLLLFFREFGLVIGRA